MVWIALTAHIRRYAVSSVSLRCLAAALVIFPAAAAAAEPLAFEVRYARELRPGPVSARVYVMLGPAVGLREPRFGPDWFRPQPFFAVDAIQWKAGEPLHFGAEAIGCPGPLKDLPAGTYAAQAVMRLNRDSSKLGDGEGNAYGPVVKAAIDPAASGTIALTIDKIVQPLPFNETDRLKLVDIPSPLLSGHHMRAIRQRAAVILPKDGVLPGKRYPTLYIIPGFGGTHRMAAMFMGAPRLAFGQDLIRVILDPDCGTGHHVFADSAFNGPHGRALIEELIPYIEKTYPAVAEPGARLLNGHSSGGWSSLWLQVTYPDFFGGTWSTSPDPVDFRDFSAIDLYAPGANVFRDAAGNRRPIVRMGGKAVVFVEPFSKMEDVIGDGGQLHSFEAVFSPLTPHGRPRPLWDRATGTVDPETAKGWEKYDIRLVLERNWKTLGPKLSGKLHVITGEVDTFYLEGAVKLLRESLQKLASDAVVEIVPGKDHSNLMSVELAGRLDREMNAAVRRYLPEPKAAAGGQP
jgi:S-formylglutathione hydrolase FrmB